MISLRLAVAVAVIGAVGPFVGSYEFVREDRSGRVRRRPPPIRRARVSPSSSWRSTRQSQVTLPAMGESVTEGTVLEWHKQEGDRVEADETLVEISTDKVDAEVPSPASGTSSKIHAAEGDTVDGRPVLARDRDRRRRRAAATTNGSGNGAAGGAPPPRPSPSEPARSIDIVTPAGGESVTEGTILEWAVKVGDTVADGQTVVEISTDKVDMELPAPAAGTITEILAEEGETVTVGQVIARMTTARARPPPPAAAERRDGPTPATPRRHGAPRRPTAPRSRPSPRASPPPRASTSRASPAPARGGRITKSDVLDGPATAPRAPGRRGSAAAASRAARRCSRATWTRAARSRRRPRSARSPSPRWTRRRKQLKDAGQKVSFTHLIAYAIALAATNDMPVMAHHFVEVDGKPHPLDDGAVNLGIAVDVEKKDGSRTLMVPVIRDAGRMPFRDFKAAFDELIDRRATTR